MGNHSDAVLLTPGLLALDTLALPLPSLLLIGLNLWLWHSAVSVLRAAIMSLLCAAGVGWGRMLCFDVTLTWNQLGNLHSFPALSDIAFLNHLKYQPPAWTWYLAACPSYPMQQINALAVAALIIGLCFRLYPDTTARRILATPLFALMASQPMTGVYAVACLLAARVLWRDGCKTAALVAAFLASQWTYTAYAVYPLLALEFGAYGVFLLLAASVYWLAFATSNTRTYAVQWQFVTRMFTLGAFDGASVKTTAAVMARNGRRLDRNLVTLLSAGVYLFPAWRRVAWWVFLLGGLITIGGGNVKYLALLAACLPATRDGLAHHQRV